MAGMAERQKEWQNSRMAEMATCVLFIVHTDDAAAAADDDDDDNNDTLIIYITDLCNLPSVNRIPLHISLLKIYLGHLLECP